MMLLTWHTDYKSCLTQGQIVVGAEVDMASSTPGLCHGSMHTCAKVQMDFWKMRDAKLSLGIHNRIYVLLWPIYLRALSWDRAQATRTPVFYLVNWEWSQKCWTPSTLWNVQNTPRQNDSHNSGEQSMPHIDLPARSSSHMIQLEACINNNNSGCSVLAWSLFY